MQQSLEAAWGFYQYGLANEAVTTILDSLQQHPDSQELSEALAEITNASTSAPLPQQLDQPAVAVPKLAPAMASPPPKKEEPVVAAPAAPPAPSAAPPTPSKEAPVSTRKSVEARIANIFQLPTEQLKPAAAEKPEEPPSPKADTPPPEPQLVVASAPSAGDIPKIEKKITIPKANGQTKRRHPDQDVIAGLTAEMPDRRACVKRMYGQKAQKAAAKAIIDLTQDADRKKNQEKN